MFSFFLPNSNCQLIDPREKSNTEINSSKATSPTGRERTRGGLQSSRETRAAGWAAGYHTHMQTVGAEAGGEGGGGGRDGWLMY